MSHVMIDLETLGTTPNSVILSIGAATFDFLSSKSMETLKIKVDIGSCLLAGLDINKQTIDWWKNQSAAAKEQTFGADGRHSLRLALDKLTEYYMTVNGKFVWGNGSDFDIALLRRAYDLCDMETPWHYRNVRCFRTFMSLFGIDSDWVKPTIAHDCTSDALAQVMTLTNACQRMDISFH